MAVLQERDSSGYRFTVRPNCALSWRATKYLVLFFACCFCVVGMYFASIGAWLVLPFAGLELVVLAAGFYLSAVAGHSREVIWIEGPVVRVLRGGRRLEQVASFPANWTRALLLRDPSGWYPSRLVLRCHGRRLEIATKVVEVEREELAAALDGWLGFGHSRDPDDTSEAIRPVPELQVQKLPGGGAPARFETKAIRIETDGGNPPGAKAARSAGSEF